MNEKRMQRLTAITCFEFAIFCLLWVLMNYTLLPLTEGQKDYSILIRDPQWTLIAVIGLLSSVFGLFAVMGTYHVTRNEGGLILFIGSIILVFGLMLEMGALTWDTFIWPVICANENYITFISSGTFINTIQFKIYIFSMLGFLLLGTILFAIGLYKAKKIGKIVPAFLILGILLYAAGNMTIILIASIGLVIYNIAFLIIGVRLLKS
jgi:hypothetical protein